MQRVDSQTDRKARLGLIAAFAAAVAASACCTIPLLLVALGVGTVAALALIASPWMIRALSPPEGASGSEAAPTALAAAPASRAQVVLDVEGMTCASCHVTVRRALRNVAGVEAAEVSAPACRRNLRPHPRHRHRAH